MKKLTHIYTCSYNLFAGLSQTSLGEQVVAHLNAVQQPPYQNKEQSKRARTAGSQPSVYSITAFEPAPVGASRTMLNQLSKEIILVIAITIQYYDMEIEHKFSPPTYHGLESSYFSRLPSQTTQA
jgi:hypothetical protein